MVTVKIMGGLGNQLNAYAAGYALARERDEELVLDISDYYNGYTFSYYLDFLNIPVHKKVSYISRSGTPLLPENIPKEMYGRFDKLICQEQGIRTAKQLRKAAKSAKKPYLLGYWGVRYAKAWEQELKEMFVLRTPSQTLEAFKVQIKGHTSVAVHLRRKAFVDLKWDTNIDYYKAAIAYMSGRYPDAMFYFFSDDIDFAKDSFGDGENYRYVKITGGELSDLEELFCLSACNHRILASRSTYGDWASRLCEFKNKEDVLYQEPGRLPETGRFVCLDDGKVKVLSEAYCLKKRSVPKKTTDKVREEVEQCLAGNKNERAMEILNEQSFDFFNSDHQMYIDMLSYRGIAQAQLGNSLEACQCFYRQNQYAKGDGDFHYNYFQALEQRRPKSLEGMIQAVMAVRSLNDKALILELEDYYKEDQKKLKLFRLLYSTAKKHFIVAPLQNAHYYTKFSQSLAVLLKYMGHEVSYINPPIRIDVQGDITEAQTVLFGLNNARPYSTDYSYGFHIYPTVFEVRKRGNIYHTQPLIRELSGKYACPTYVLGRHPDVFPLRGSTKYAKYLFLDFHDYMDGEREFPVTKDRQCLHYMYTNADACIFTDTGSYKKYAHLVKNSVLFSEKREGGPEVMDIDSLVFGTANYMNTDHMIRLAQAVIQAADKI